MRLPPMRRVERRAVVAERWAPAPPQTQRGAKEKTLKTNFLLRRPEYNAAYIVTTHRCHAERD
jgi:hypothetical protein